MPCARSYFVLLRRRRPSGRCQKISLGLQIVSSRRFSDWMLLSSGTLADTSKLVQSGLEGECPLKEIRCSFFLGAANMDPAVYRDPQQFRLDRHEEPPPLTFGSGMHYCLGSSLVKLELRLAIQHLCSRCQSIELHGDFERLADVDVGNWGFRRLNVRLISA
mmetsp:Transcript_32285/g.75407  ORF Transcript_32285/g.75407 Transcript_32285/m.75407 type:complete len:162 (-) Transcript_32285:14-499(-)